MEIRVKIDTEVVFRLNYEQAKALDAMAGYGADAFLKVFKEKLGKHYIEPYENGIRSLFEEIRGSGKPIQKAIYKTDKLRRDIQRLNEQESKQVGSNKQ